MRTPQAALTHAPVDASGPKGSHPPERMQQEAECLADSRDDHVRDADRRTGGGRHEGNEQERANQRIEHGGLLCVSGLFTRLA